ncbi:MAG: formate dehydrogenase family accessory protein FdhD [Caulobacterales bacterium 68-7]|nr:formate dehydrogenase accessory sulfurtransferase FdhD [Caulobacterales bacterium]OJU12182.1 MAG: formate dehydrogenase family accessory protein FdhD [Caulobacterales bacterium 68-7]
MRPFSRTSRPVAPLKWRRGGAAVEERLVPEEAPVAIVHDGTTSAVLMATPADVEDLAIGFTLSEGIVDTLSDILEIEVVEVEQGIEARVWLARDPGQRLAARRRRMVGPTGCGLCGVDSLAEAVRPVATVGAGPLLRAEDLLTAMAAMAEAQAVGAATRAAHAAGYWRDGGLVAVREDVGRHNALDKLIGDLARQAVPADGVVLLTSRVSVEMVQKTAAYGAAMICAVSAPTALAIEVAEAAGITLVAVCRPDGFEVFAHPERLDLG